MIELLKSSEGKFDYMFKDALIEGEIFTESIERALEGALQKVKYEAIETGNLIQVLRNVLRFAKDKSLVIIQDIERVDKARAQIAQQKIERSNFNDISDFNLIDYSINPAYKSIATGDIFEITLEGAHDNYYGILISPECDLPIRFTGRTTQEVGRNLKDLTLYLFDVYPLHSDKLGSKLEKDENIWPVKNFQGCKKHFALVPAKQSIQVDARILDLCTLNSTGIACIQHDYDEFITFKTAQFEMYYEKELSLWCNDLLQMNKYLSLIPWSKEVAVTKQDEPTYLKVEGLTSDCSEFFSVSHAHLLGTLIQLKYGIAFDLENQSFKVKRIGHLDSRRTSQLAQRHANSNSRLGAQPNIHIMGQP